MTLYRTLFVALVAAAVFGVTPQARSQERAVINVTVDENGRTIVRCDGAECKTVDCSGVAQNMTTNIAYVVQSDGSDSCVSGLASDDLSDFLDRVQEEITDLLLGSENPVTDGGVNTGFLDNDEDNQNQVQDLGEDSDESPNTL